MYDNLFLLSFFGVQNIIKPQTCKILCPLLY